MSAFVLDCSVAAAWLFEDEANNLTNALLDTLKDTGAVVPSLWHLQLSNVLLQAEKRGRITAAQIAARIELVSSLPIDTDFESHTRALRETLSLARDHSLTPYDAAYLELAMRRGLPLATQDKALKRAARNVDVAGLL